MARGWLWDIMTTMLDIFHLEHEQLTMFYVAMVFLLLLDYVAMPSWLFMVDYKISL